MERHKKQMKTTLFIGSLVKNNIYFYYYTFEMHADSHSFTLYLFEHV